MPGVCVINSLNLDSRCNMFFCPTGTPFSTEGCGCLSAVGGSGNRFAFVPLPNKNAKGRRKVNLDGVSWGESTTFQYHVLCTPDLKEPIHRFDGPEKDAGYTVHSLSFPNLGPLTSHVRPHFVVANSALKLTRLALAQFPQQTRYDYRLYAQWMQLDIPTGFTGSGDGNRPDNASRPPSKRAPSADGEGDEPDDGSNSTDAESENGDSAESQSSDTEETVMHDDEWSSAEETAWIEEICDWTEKCREATSSEGGWAPDAVNDEQMAAYAKEPSAPAPPP
ncbi:hypothetical protein BU15DRAFT_81310 [Melanogaster broomeanus]|nr:hypothetical protein BU15DRAFT_81310 [Melanogaster broomeanus]